MRLIRDKMMLSVSPETQSRFPHYSGLPNNLALKQSGRQSHFAPE